MKNNRIKQKLQRLAEENYQTFSSKLIPNIRKETVLGVRLPELRKIAREIVKSDWNVYLNTASGDSFEEIMLQGMVIGYLSEPIDQILYQIKAFIPKIDNWSTCDSFCSGLKITQKYPDSMWDFIIPYVMDTREYYIRFGVVMMKCYYLNQQYIEDVIDLLDSIRSNDYYVKMAVAWTLSISFISFPDEITEYLKNSRLDDFTYNKTLQKIIESLKVDTETKNIIRTMKRNKAREGLAYDRE